MGTNTFTTRLQDCLKAVHLTAQRRAVLSAFSQLYRAGIITTNQFAWIIHIPGEVAASERFKIQVNERPSSADLDVWISKNNHGTWVPFTVSQLDEKGLCQVRGLFSDAGELLHFSFQKKRLSWIEIHNFLEYLELHNIDLLLISRMNAGTRPECMAGARSFTVMPTVIDALKTDGVICSQPIGLSLKQIVWYQYEGGTTIVAEGNKYLTINIKEWLVHFPLPK